MPTGPNGQKRPADTNAAAVMVARIAVGEIDEAPIMKRGLPGGLARADALTAESKIKIASAAAKARWSGEKKMRSDEMSTTKRGDAAEATALLMYPNNELKAPVRTFAETFSGFTLVREQFGNK